MYKKDGNNKYTNQSILVYTTLLSKLIQKTKLQNNNLELHYVNSYKTKLSQFDHTTLEYHPSELNERTKVVDDHILQR